MRDAFGDYQRQLFLVDHAGMPLKMVLEQLDILGETIVPALRKEFAKDRPADVPAGPTHASQVALAAAGKLPVPGGVTASVEAKPRTGAAFGVEP